MVYLEMYAIFLNIHRFRKHILASYDFSPPSIITKFISTSKVNIYEYQSSNFIHLYFLCILKAMTLFSVLYSPTFSYSFPSHIQKRKENSGFGEACFLLIPTSISSWLIPRQRQSRFMSQRDKR